MNNNFSSITTTSGLISGGSISTGTTDLSYDYVLNTSSEILRNIIPYFSESELEKAIDILISRMKTFEEEKIPSDLTAFIEAIIKYNHVSEEFLLKYVVDYVPKYVIKDFYRSEIVTGKYSKLALLFEIKK